MRIKTASTKPPVEGSERVKTRFLILPKKIANEWRWLEKTKWKQKCVKMFQYSPMSPPTPLKIPDSFGIPYLVWINTEWL